MVLYSGLLLYKYLFRTIVVAPAAFQGVAGLNKKEVIMAGALVDGIAQLVQAIADSMTGMGALMALNAEASAAATGTSAQSMTTAMFAATAAPWIEEAGNLISGIALVMSEVAGLFA